MEFQKLISKSPNSSQGTGIRGRSLNLNQGVVESTENIYKYHMQLPLTQNGKSSTSHSRNESQSSTNSKQTTQPPVAVSDESKTQA